MISSTLIRPPAIIAGKICAMHPEINSIATLTGLRFSFGAVSAASPKLAI